MRQVHAISAQELNGGAHLKRHPFGRVPAFADGDFRLPGRSNATDAKPVRTRDGRRLGRRHSIIRWRRELRAGPPF
jgi:hypothetical protein